MKYLENEMFYGLVVIALLSLGAYMFQNALDMPTVESSNATGECVEVINYAEGDDYDCDNLPERYNHRWVR